MERLNNIDINDYKKTFSLLIDLLNQYNSDDIGFMVWTLGRTFLSKQNQEDRVVYIKDTNIKLARNFDRVTFGRTGIYIEISNEDLIKDNIIVKPGHEFRINSTKYHCTFELYTDKPTRKCSLYKQIGKCKYSDFRIGYYHINILDIYL